MKIAGQRRLYRDGALTPGPLKSFFSDLQSCDRENLVWGTAPEKQQLHLYQNWCQGFFQRQNSYKQWEAILHVRDLNNIVVWLLNPTLTQPSCFPSRRHSFLGFLCNAHYLAECHCVAPFFPWHCAFISRWWHTHFFLPLTHHTRRSNLSDNGPHSTGRALGLVVSFLSSFSTSLTYVSAWSPHTALGSCVRWYSNM